MKKWQRRERVKEEPNNAAHHLHFTCLYLANTQQSRHITFTDPHTHKRRTHNAYNVYSKYKVCPNNNEQTFRQRKHITILFFGEYAADDDDDADGTATATHNSRSVLPSRCSLSLSLFNSRSHSLTFHIFWIGIWHPRYANVSVQHSVRAEIP